MLASLVRLVRRAHGEIAQCRRLPPAPGPQDRSRRRSRRPARPGDPDARPRAAAAQLPARRRRLPHRHPGAAARAADASAQRDAAAGLDTRASCQRLPRLAAGHGRPAGVEGRQVPPGAQVRFLPAINEDLAATAVLGTQRVESDPERRVDGVFAMWYGKGPGVDRAATRSSTATSTVQFAARRRAGGGRRRPRLRLQFDAAPERRWFCRPGALPVLRRAMSDLYLEFGLYGWALSRFSAAPGSASRPRRRWSRAA
jgi:indolepyruvate ferredoxin oxidoreductase